MGTYVCFALLNWGGDSWQSHCWQGCGHWRKDRLGLDHDRLRRDLDVANVVDDTFLSVAILCDLQNSTLSQLSKLL